MLSYYEIIHVLWRQSKKITTHTYQTTITCLVTKLYQTFREQIRFKQSYMCSAGTASVKCHMCNYTSQHDFGLSLIHI